MMPVRILGRYWWLLVPVFALVGGYIWHTGTIQQKWAYISGTPPHIKYPTEIDLGVRTANEVVVCKLEVLNHGGQDLVIDQIRSSCTCSTLERKTDGDYAPIEELRIPPGGRTEVIVRVTVRVAEPGAFSQTVSFVTNDPDQPEGRIKVVFRTVGGGIKVQPSAIQFGRVLVGRESRQVVNVIDRDVSPQTVTRVVSSDPDKVAVRWGPASTPEQSEAGILLGRIEVVPNIAQIQLLDTTITITFADARIEPFIIPVSGRVVPRFTVSPESLVLPLSTGGGPIYTSKCVIREYDGHPVRLEVVSSTPDLRVEVSDSPGDAVKVVQITWTPVDGEPPGTNRKMVRLRATVGEEAQTLDIPVTCERPN